MTIHFVTLGVGTSAEADIRPDPEVARFYQEADTYMWGQVTKLPRPKNKKVKLVISDPRDPGLPGARTLWLWISHERKPLEKAIRAYFKGKDAPKLITLNVIKKG